MRVSEQSISTDLLVIGAGAAGLSAAIRAMRAGVDLVTPLLSNVFPLIIADIFDVALSIAIPQISLFLPSMMK